VKIIAIIARVLAIGIAVLGVVDPAMTSLREGSPDIALVGDSTIARQVRDRLGDNYRVVDGAWDKASATIIVGNALADRIPAGRVFAVRDSSVAVERFVVPAEVTSAARIPIAVRAPNAIVKLHANNAVVDSVIPRGVIPSEAPVPRSGSDEGRDPHLTFAPWSPGVFTLEARAHRGNDSASVFAITNVVDRSHAVLFFDRRPSWMSTFVRRSLEADRRFSVASRVVTSRNVSTSAGQPPSSLADPGVLELYDVIVIGAPTALTAGDVAGLEQFLRRRGGAVVLLYDGPPTRGVHDRLTGVTSWTTRQLRTPIAATAEEDTVALRFTETTVPLKWTGIHRTIAATSRPDTANDIVWATTIGAGQIIVSGALDSWKYRDRTTSGFDEFWRSTISRAAREASQVVTIQATPNLARPGERVAIKVTVRDSLATPTVQLDSNPVQMWRGDRAGEYVGMVRAPSDGEHWLNAFAGGARVEAPLVVRGNVSRVATDDWSTVSRVARASGGVGGSLDSVVSAVKERVVRERRPERWWPMRSAWWIVPFALLLGLEWFVRRRRGLA
jgi:hypothetical protein